MRFLRGLRLCRLFRISRNERGFSMIEVIMATALMEEEHFLLYSFRNHYIVPT